MPINASLARYVILSILGSLGFIAAGLLGFAGLMAMRPQPQRAEELARVYAVETILVHLQTFHEKIVAYGTARALQSSRVSSRVSGQVNWKREGLRPGVWVETGEKLLSLDPRPFETELRRRRGVVEQSRAELGRLAISEQAALDQKEVAARDLQLAKTDYERALDLVGRSVISPRERDQKEMAFSVAERAMIEITQRHAEVASEIDRARAVLEQAEASVAQAQLDLEFAVIKAPFAGTVQSVSAEVGEVVGMGMSGAMIEVVATDKVEIPIKLPASRVADIAVGQPVQLRRPGRGENQGVAWVGKIARIAPKIDEATRAIEVYVLAENDPNDARPDLLPGAFVMAELQGREFPNVVAIPRQAVIDGRAYVVGQGEAREGAVAGPVARERVAKVRAYANGQAVIESGLQDGDQVILTNLDVIYDGAPIKPLPRGPKAVEAEAVEVAAEVEEPAS
jgi:RND family efflux transporter MFP subunit